MTETPQEKPKPHDLGKVKINLGTGRKPEPEKKDDSKQ